MPDPRQIILGEFRRKIDDRYRLAIPDELAALLAAESGECVLAKERPGCLSLWSAELWQAKVNVRIDVAKQKVQSGLSDDRIGQVQLLGRLLSTRHQHVQLAGRGRLLVPKSFRDFLGVNPQQSAKYVMVVGAAVCVEIWNPAEWLKYQQGRMSKFRHLLEKLS